MKRLSLLFLVTILLSSCTSDTSKVKSALIKYSNEQARIDKYYLNKIENIEKLEILSKNRTTYTYSGDGTKYYYKATIMYIDYKGERRNCIDCKNDIFIADNGEIHN